LLQTSRSTSDAITIANQNAELLGEEVNMDNSQPSFLGLAAKTMVAHSVTYFIMGALAAHFLNYAATMAAPDSGMRPIVSPWVMAGPLFQPIRGLVFASVFYLLRSCLFGKRNGWLLMAWMLIALGILSTFGPVSGSLEGMVYTPVPILFQLRGWLEIVPQAVLLSGLLCYWVNHPEKKWLNWTLGVVFFVMMAMPVLGLLVRRG
jgi:hypothetical protein